MSYNSIESSANSGKPVFLYEFIQGSTTWRLTSAPYDIVWNALTWTASTVSHSEVKQTNEMSKGNLDLTFAIDDAFAAQFLGYAPDQITTISIRRFHTGDPDAVVYWKGRIVGSAGSNKSIKINCESIFTSLRRSGLRARYQISCRHALYMVGCNLNKSSFATAGVVSAVSGNTVTIPSIAGDAAGWRVGGMLEYETYLRLITAQNGGLLTLSNPIKALTDDFAISGAGVLSVNTYPGCDRTRETCTNKFANWINFGGFPWIPAKNPMGGSSIV